MSDQDQALLKFKLFAFPCNDYCSTQYIIEAFDFTLKEELLAGAKDSD